MHDPALCKSWTGHQTGLGCHPEEALPDIDKMANSPASTDHQPAVLYIEELKVADALAM